MKIEYKLEKFNFALAFQVVSLDESFIGDEKDINTYTVADANNTFKRIVSGGSGVAATSGIKVDHIVLPSRCVDNEKYPVSVQFYDTNALRDTAHDFIVAAIAEWASTYTFTSPVNNSTLVPDLTQIP